MTRQKKYWYAMCIAAFLSIISFFQINSYVADKNGLNTFFLIAGIVLAAGAVYCLVKGVINPPGTDKH